MAAPRKRSEPLSNAELFEARSLEPLAARMRPRTLDEVVGQAEQRRRLGRGTILFADEIHRFNKAQQDAFLPHVEAGTITLIGATTENPSFEINQALLSRVRVFVLQPIAREDIVKLVERAVADSERGLGARRLTLDEDAIDMLATQSDGDDRRALTVLEAAAD